MMVINAIVVVLLKLKKIQFSRSSLSETHLIHFPMHFAKIYGSRALGNISHYEEGSEMTLYENKFTQLRSTMHGLIDECERMLIVCFLR